MIKLINSGEYKLSEALDAAKIITLSDEGTFAWSIINGFGETLEAIPSNSIRTNIISGGKYRLYQVRNEINLTNGAHLELCIGTGIWNAYLLPNGPLTNDGVHLIIPTKEIITRSSGRFQILINSSSSL